MQENKEIQGLFDFIEKSPTAYHTIKNTEEWLLHSGFEKLRESCNWSLREGGRYFVTRSESSLIAFSVPHKAYRAFSIIAPHGDSPCFKLKEYPEIRIEDKYTKLNTEVYGGMQLNLWTDRPLSAAGALFVRGQNETEGEIKIHLFDMKRDIALIPGLAIHMNRDINNSAKFNPQVDMLPLFGGKTADFLALAAAEAGVAREDILSFDISLYNSQRGKLFGAENEFIASPKLDDLECVFSALCAFSESENEKGDIDMLALFDSEEIGSMTRQGADSTFLSDTLCRIGEVFGKSGAEHNRSLAESFMLSADNAHAVHPNYPEKTDPTNRCYLNGGVVIKHSPSYATSAETAARFKLVCKAAGAETQSFYNRSDMRGGSTLGNISGTHVSVPAVDIGLAQLSMHSPYETAGAHDLEHMIKAMKAFCKTGAGYACL